MRTIAMATVLVLGMMSGYAHAQYVGIPKTFQPSLDAARPSASAEEPAAHGRAGRQGHAVPHRRRARHAARHRGARRDPHHGLARHRHDDWSADSRAGWRTIAARFATACRRCASTSRARSRRQAGTAHGAGRGRRHWPGTRPRLASAARRRSTRSTDRLVQLWSLPHAVYKAAMLAGANAKVTLEGGVALPVVSAAGAAHRHGARRAEHDRCHRAHDGQRRKVPVELLDRSRRNARGQRRHRNDVLATTRN